MREEPSYFGWSVSGAGDVNADGFADLIVGAVGDDNNFDTSGSARVFSGRDGSILFTSNGDSALASFGKSVSGAGDVDADGFADLIVGAWRDNTNGDRSGSAHVISMIVSVDTPVGSPNGGITVEPVDSRTGEAIATITYDNVTEAGTTAVISTVLEPGQEAPAGFMLGDPPVVFNVFTTATFEGEVEVCFD